MQVRLQKIQVKFAHQLIYAVPGFSGKDKLLTYKHRHLVKRAQRYYTGIVSKPCMQQLIHIIFV